MKKYNILYGIVAMAALLLGLSCTDNKETLGDSVVIENDAYVLDDTSAGGIHTFVMYSNIGPWKLEPTYEEDWEWITAFPKEGKNDARFKVLVQQNDDAYPRTCELNIVNSKGVVMSKLTFNQKGANPKMQLLYKKPVKICSALGEQFKIKVDANIDWQVIIPEECREWLSSVEHTREYEIFQVLPNESDTERIAPLRFFAEGPSISQDLSINQAKHSDSFETAEKISIKDLREMLGNAAGTVSANVYIEGYVVSDYASGNFPEACMYLQDESDAGIMIKFDDADSNDYPLNSLVTIHMYGLSAVVDSVTGMLSFSDMTRAYVMKSVESQGIAPIAIEDVTMASQFESCLVTLKDVEFVLPIGTYANLQETYIDFVYDLSTYDITNSLPYSEYCYEFVHPLRDKLGNKIELMTLGHSNFRAARMIKDGVGDVTGVVTSRIKYDGQRWNIRMRSLEDDQVSEDPATRRSKIVMQIGPWLTHNNGLDKAVAHIGTGQVINASTKENVAPSSASGSTFMYFAPAYARCKPAEYIDGTWYPLYANNTDVQYYCIVAQNWWQNNFSRILDCEGNAWIIKTSTAGVHGQLSFEMTQGSSSSGPLYFTLEWSNDENAPLEEWHQVVTYPVCNTSCSYTHKIISHDLPAECCDQSNLVIRLRVPTSRRAKNTGTPIDTGGTSRFAEIRISCR